MGITLSDLTRFEPAVPFESGGVSHDVYYRGAGPPVIVMHELPGVTNSVLGLAERVSSRGFRVAVPHLLGVRGKQSNPLSLATTLIQVCVSKEFSLWSTDTPGPVIEWLKALAKHLSREGGGSPVGAIGLCFSGNFALALVADSEARVTAPVISEPALPLPIGRRRASFQVSPEELANIRERMEAEDMTAICARFTQDDRCPPERIAAMRTALGHRLETHEIPGKQHSVLTTDLVDDGKHQTAQVLARVLTFLEERLKPGADPP